MVRVLRLAESAAPAFHIVSGGMSGFGRGWPMKPRRGKRIKLRPRRRNPVARVLRDPAFRARREANRRGYSRKLKHKRARESEQQ